MFAQGVDPNDFERITGGIDSWETWPDRWGDAADGYARTAAEAQEQGRTVTAATAWLRAATLYHFSRFVWVVDMARNQEILGKAVAAYRTALEQLDPTFQRLEIAVPGGTLVAHLRRPAGLDRTPLVILLPGLDSTKEEFFNWESVFLQRGLATLTVEGYGQGETFASFGISADYPAAVTAAIDTLESLPGIDTDAIGLVGVSLGGFYATLTAAFEKRLTAVVNVSGAYDLSAVPDRGKTLSRSVYYAYSKARDEDEFRAIMARMSLRGIAENATQPMLVVVGGADKVRDPAQMLQTANEAPNASLLRFDDGNHVLFNMHTVVWPKVGDWIHGQLHQ